VRRDEDIYAAVLRRVVAGDHGWGKPYDFQVLYVLDHAVPGVEDSLADLDKLVPNPPFEQGLQPALRAKLADLPLVTFVATIPELYEAQSSDSIQMRDGGGVARGPINEDLHTASVGVMFFGRYGGRHWARWLRYHLELDDDSWLIASCELLAVT
jgi:hypothetical protein